MPSSPGPVRAGSPTLPAPRGDLSAALFRHWRAGGARALPPVADLDRTLAAVVDPLTDDDLHLALWAAYELHHHGFAGLADDLEWDGPTLAFRAALERTFEAALRAEIPAGDLDRDPREALVAVAARGGPPLAATVARSATRDQLREIAVHRSAYQLKEADPHTWVIPRLRGPARSALIEIQADEYGGGVPGAAHAELFALAMAELDLCADFGHYVDRLPGVTLATDNLIDLFGLHRRLRGAVVGHLALFEMCSVAPMSRYLAAATRLGGLPATERFYRVHVEVDDHHAQLALDELVGRLAHDEPDLAPDIVFGAEALARVEARFAAHVLHAWSRGRSSLRQPGEPPRPGPRQPGQKRDALDQPGVGPASRMRSRRVGSDRLRAADPTPLRTTVPVPTS